MSICEYEKSDKTAPNNHVINAYAKYITDVLTGYFVGQPIAYTAKEGGERLLELLADIYEYNDEQAENMALAKGASINGEADWLVKNVNDTWVENYKNRINADTHKFSFTPDLTDEQFAGNASGVSLRYKLMGMEQIRATKERGFKKGLQRRIELICNRLALINSVEDWRTIDMTFNNTLPQNLLELSQIVGNLFPYLSNETLLSLLYFIDDPQVEIERKEAEQEEQAVKNCASMMALADTSTNEGTSDDES